MEDPEVRTIRFSDGPEDSPASAPAAAERRPGTPAPGDMRTYPRGILKSAGSRTRRTAPSILVKEGAHTIKVHPTKTPTVPIKRPRKHFHGTRRLRVVAPPKAAAKASAEAIRSEIAGLSREELVDKLAVKGLVKSKTKTPVSMLQNIYENARLSGLL